MSRVTLLAAMLVLGCSEASLIGGVSPPGVVEPDAPCDVDADDTLVQLDAGDPVAMVSFFHDCAGGADLVWSIDDPDDAFGITGPGLDFVDEGEDFDIEIELLPSEPGVYEAQLTVEAPDFGAGLTIELVGEIE